MKDKPRVEALKELGDLIAHASKTPSQTLYLISMYKKPDGNTLIETRGVMDVENGTPGNIMVQGLHELVRLIAGQFDIKPQELLGDLIKGFDNE